MDAWNGLVFCFVGLCLAAGRWLERTRMLPFVDTLRSAIDKVQAAVPRTRQREVERKELLHRRGSYSGLFEKQFTHQAGAPTARLNPLVA